MKLKWVNESLKLHGLGALLLQRNGKLIDCFMVRRACY